MSASSTERPGLTPRDLVLTLRDLPSPPEAYYALSRLLDGPDWTAEQAAALIEREPALSARLLRLCNSPFYGLARAIGSVSEAVMVVGSRELRDLVLLTSILESFPRLSCELISVRQFWLRALRTGLTAQALGRAAKHPAPGELLAAGLLHDIGSLIVCLKLPEQARQALLLHHRPDDPSFTIERTVFRSDAGLVGAELVREWRLPELLEAAVTWYPQPERAGAHVAAAALVGLARHVAVAVETAAGLDASELGPLVTAAGLVPEAVDPAREQADACFETALAAFDLH